MSFLQATLDNPQHLVSSERLLSDGTQIGILDTGIIRLLPENPVAAHKLIISSGIHGNETAPMEIVDTLISDIEAGRLAVKIEVLFIIGNPPAAVLEKRFVHDNLNRLFSGKHREYDSTEAQRAKQLERIVDDFFSSPNGSGGLRLHYDLHTAIRGSQLEKFAVYPYLSDDRSWSSSQIGFLEKCGIEAVLLSNQPSGTFSFFTSETYGAHSFTVELGKVRKFGENDMSRFKDIDLGLRKLISGQEPFDSRPQSIKIFSVVEEVIKQTEAFKLHVADDAKNFTEFPAGSLLASDRDYEYRTRTDGERFVFPISNVPCGQRAMLVVAPTQLD